MRRLAAPISCLLLLALGGCSSFNRAEQECGFPGNCCWADKTCNAGAVCNPQTMLCERAPDGPSADLARPDGPAGDRSATDLPAKDLASGKDLSLDKPPALDTKLDKPAVVPDQPQPKPDQPQPKPDQSKPDQSQSKPDKKVAPDQSSG